MRKISDKNIEKVITIFQPYFAKKITVQTMKAAYFFDMGFMFSRGYSKQEYQEMYCSSHFSTQIRDGLFIALKELGIPEVSIFINTNSVK